jgi:hypothetical protein
MKRFAMTLSHQEVGNKVAGFSIVFGFLGFWKPKSFETEKCHYTWPSCGKPGLMKRTCGELHNE